MNIAKVDVTEQPGESPAGPAVGRGTGGFSRVMWRIPRGFFAMLFKYHTEQKNVISAFPVVVLPFVGKKERKWSGLPQLKLISLYWPHICVGFVKMTFSMLILFSKVTEELLKLASLGLFSASTRGCRSWGKSRGSPSEELQPK